MEKHNLAGDGQSEREQQYNYEHECALCNRTASRRRRMDVANIGIMIK